MFYIYRITNKVNGKTYIGQHKYKYINDDYMGSGILLHRAFKKYGKENFSKEIIYSRIQLQETANSVEKFAIAKERKLGKAEYNIATGGEGGHTRYGTESQKEASRKTGLKNRKISTYWNEYIYYYSSILKANTKHFHSIETKMKISEKAKGRKSYWKGKYLPEETKRKISETRKNRHIEPWNKGLKGFGIPWNKGKKGIYSEETIRKMAEAKKGKNVGMHWFNNGTIEIKAFECPEGFVLGRIRKY